MKILLAEDDSSISFVAKTCLEKIGKHEVILVSNGEEALLKVSADSFDLILLDGMMPKKTGLQVAETLKTQKEFKTPIIFLSAKNEEQEVLKFMSLGCGYISKPFDPIKLCSQIDEQYQKLKAAA